jgi:hypothetical protein
LGALEKTRSPWRSQARKGGTRSVFMSFMIGLPVQFFLQNTKALLFGHLNT